MTLAELKEWISYCPKTGEITWVAGPRTGLPALATQHADGYLCGTVNGEDWLAHRAAWFLETGELPKGQIDHKDGVRDNNVFTNFRDVTQAVNAKNRKTQTNSPLPQGVNYRPRQTKRPYTARLGKHGKVFLGSYATVEEAVAAYRQGLIDHGYSSRHGQ